MENGNGLTREEVMRKIQKLMALATSPNEAEATLALEKCAELMEKYAITLGDCQTEEEVKTNMIRLDLKGRTPRTVMWEAILAHGLGECFEVETVRYMKQDGWHLAFMGTKADVDMVIYFTKYLRRSVGRITDLENQGRGRSTRNTFAHGMVNQIIQRMGVMYRKRQEIKTSDSLALVTVKKIETEKLKREQFPKLRSASVRISNNPGAWKRGAAAGDKVSIRTGVNGRAANGSLR